jgi:hypothetical protein
VLDAVRFWKENAFLSAVRVRDFSFDNKTQRYFHVHTYGNVEVYHAGARVASIPIPYDSAQTLAFTRTMKLDTVLLFHPLTPTVRITRQGAHDQWDARSLTYLSVPLFDYDGTKAGGVNEVQAIHFTSAVAGDTFEIVLEGQASSSVTYAGSNGTTAAAIQAALEGLGNVGAGNVTCANTGTDVFTVTFVGDTAAEDIGEMATKMLHTSAGSTYVATQVEGVEGGEDVISDARGWPSTGTFYQGRLYVGGLKSRPQTVLGSRITNSFQLKSQGSDTDINEDLDTNDTTTITQLFPGQHLQLFTSAAEFYFPNEPIVAPSAIKRATDRGIQPGVPPVRLPAGDGQTSTLFVVQGGGALAELLFDGFKANYTAQLISRLATHLLANPDPITNAPRNQIVDMGFRAALSPRDSDRALLIRDDGVAAVMHALREDDVTGFMRWTTEGQFLSAAGDAAREEYVATLRNGEVMLEKIDAAAILDCQVTVAGPTAGPISAPWLAGMTVTRYVDGRDAGDVVADGAGNVPLAAPALRGVSVGVLFVPRLVSLPAVFQDDPRQGLSIFGQLSILDVQVASTANLEGGQYGGDMFNFPLAAQEGLPADVGPGEQPFTGWTQLAGLGGVQNDTQWEIRQSRPGPMTILQVTSTIGT